MIDTLDCKECGGTIWVNTSLDLDDMETCWRCEHRRKILESIKKCECGAKAGGFQYHAWWCDLYVDPMAPSPNKKVKPPLKRR